MQGKLALLYSLVPGNSEESWDVGVIQRQCSCSLLMSVRNSWHWIRSTERSYLRLSTVSHVVVVLEHTVDCDAHNHSIFISKESLNIQTDTARYT